MHYVNPFAQPGRWYRGNTHIHSSVSDGILSVSECFEGYKQQKYDFLVLTDHDDVSDVSRYSESSFLAISGSELHPANPYGGTQYHIVAINIHEKIEVEKKHPNEVMAEVAEQGGISVLAHPYWSGHTLLDLLPLHGYFAVETFNTNCDMTGRAFSESHWDDLLDRTGSVVFGIASDDSHSLHDMYQGWIMVKSYELSLNSIMDSLLQGSFYSTQGPEIIDFRLEESMGLGLKSDGSASKRITSKFSPSVSVAFKAAACRGKHIHAHKDKLITEAFYDLAGDEKYVRLEITAPDGKKAWSQPIIFRTL